MNNKSKQIINEDGTKSTIIITSNDQKETKQIGKYTIVNHNKKKESAIAKKFKGSILGTDIGIKSSGFTSIAILSTVIAVSTLLIMYFMWRF